MHEGDRECAWIAIAKERVIGLIVKLAMCVIVDGGDDFWIGARRRHISRSGQRLRMLLQPAIGKWLGFTQPQVRYVCTGGQGSEGLGGQRDFKKITAINHRWVLYGAGESARKRDGA